MGTRIYDAGSGLLLGAETNEDVPKTVLFDPALQAKVDKAMRPFRGETVQLQTYSNDFNRMVLRTEGKGDSGTYFYIDLTAGKAFAIGWDYPTLLEANVGAVSTIDYKAADGTALQGVLDVLLPGSDGKNLPVVILPHGGPEARDYPRFDSLVPGLRFCAAMRSSNPTSAARAATASSSATPALASGAARCRPTFQTGLAELARQGIADPAGPV